ncbi:GNAT family N-acetyltransferase [Micromonospora sp. IBHARD004]|uniref:GNAT family N-acetyltransferase n=1 Tax=Micromonospora sp. IBHARD004 TaxID=3457764 RepID=UPI00405A2198
MLIRRETPADVDAVRAVHTAAFAKGDAPGAVPVEATLVDALRADDGWLPAFSLVATDAGGEVVGHVVCTRGTVAGAPVALGLGPLGVLPAWQRRGVGSALMHAVLGAADARDEPLVVLLGHPEYYPRFGFRPAVDLAVTPPGPWGPRFFMARPLSAWQPTIRGEFAYAKPFDAL